MASRPFRVADHVGHQPFRARARLVLDRCSGFAQGGFRPATDEDLGPGLGEDLGDLPAEPAAAAGDRADRPRKSNKVFW